MATVILATPFPTVIPNLVDGKEYTIQQITVGDVGFLKSGTTLPHIDDKANVIRYREVWRFTKTADESWYAWGKSHPCSVGNQSSSLGVSWVK